MGVVTRPDSQYYWLNLPKRKGQRGRTRVSTKILVKAADPEQTKENRRLAQLAYDAMLGDAARQRFDLPQVSGGRTFRAQAQWYLTHETPKHRGKVQEALRIQRLIDAFGDISLVDITPARWSEYETDRLADGVTVTTVGTELAVMKSILKSAVGEWIKAHALGTVKRKRDKLPAKRTLTREEERPFLAALKRLDREIHDLYVVGVGTLLRQEPLINLQRASHRGDRLALLTKTGPHQIPLTGPTPLQTRAAAVLKRRWPKTHTGYFFPDWQEAFAKAEDPAVPRRRFLRRVQQAAKAADVPWGIRNGGIVWHTATRASGATRMLREFQIDIRTVQMIGGWTSLDQMMEYLGMDRTVFTDDFGDTSVTRRSRATPKTRKKARKFRMRP